MYNEIVIAGILIAVIYTEISGYSTGGLVAPVYLALNQRPAPYRLHPADHPGRLGGGQTPRPLSDPVRQEALRGQRVP